jgi:hypothetical protein
VQLVAVRCDDERIARYHAECDDDEAHAPMLPGCGERRGGAALLE